ncbi:MAG: hypothetical protein ACJAT1_000710 [Marivirga sp.]|jgi:hypothetical protein
MKLFAVVLGGRAKKCNIELHDVVFAVGEKIEDTYSQLLSKWFGMPNKMHIDSYMALEVVDGYEISLEKQSQERKEQLYFINMGAYKAGDFMEHHANAFLVDSSDAQVKTRAKKSMLRGYDEVHKDDLYDVDDLLSIKEVNGYHVHLKPTIKVQQLTPINGYHVLPKEVVKTYMKELK